MDYIPYEDTKLYDDERLIDAVAFIVNQCKNCQLYHDEECIINIVRSSMEILLLGDHMDYKGSNLLYFSDLSQRNKEISDKIYTAFKNINS